MPTLEQFVATGLTPVSGQSASCAICLEDPCVDPVTIACNHIFCHDCILTYSNAPTGNKCPLCRTILFTLPTPAPNPQIANRAALARALAPTYENSPPATITDSDSTAGSEAEEENIYDTAHNFFENLAHRDGHGNMRMQVPDTTTTTTTTPFGPPPSPSTTASITTTTIIITGSGRWPSSPNLFCNRVKALGYLVRARQQITPGQGFSARLVSDWEEVLSDLNTILRKLCEKKKSRKVRKVSRLGKKLMRALKREWRKRHGRYAVWNAFLTQGRMHCVQVLLEFVEYLVWMEGRRMEREWEREGSTRCHFM